MSEVWSAEEQVDEERARRLVRAQFELGAAEVALVSEGHSSTLIIRGEAGIGKTVLLDYFAGRGSATGRVLRANGVESENDWADAGRS